MSTWRRLHVKVGTAHGLLTSRPVTPRHTWLCGHLTSCQSLSTGTPLRNDFFKGEWHERKWQIKNTWTSELIHIQKTPNYLMIYISSRLYSSYVTAEGLWWTVRPLFTIRHACNPPPLLFRNSCTPYSNVMRFGGRFKCSPLTLEISYIEIFSNMLITLYAE